MNHKIDSKPVLKLQWNETECYTEFNKKHDTFFSFLY